MYLNKQLLGSKFGSSGQGHEDELVLLPSHELCCLGRDGKILGSVVTDQHSVFYGDGQGESLPEGQSDQENEGGRVGMGAGQEGGREWVSEGMNDLGRFTGGPSRILSGMHGGGRSHTPV